MIADETIGAPLPAGHRLRLLAYAGGLMLLINFAAPSAGFIGIPVVFFLKNRLHLTAHAQATFNLWTGIPLYLSFLFGMLRDRWSPFGHGDRGHLALFGLGTAAIYAAIAFMAPTYAVLLGGLLVVTAALQTVSGSISAMVTAMGQQHLMAGQASAVLNGAINAPLVIGYLLGGALSQMLEGRDSVGAARLLFLVGAGLMAATALAAALGPRRLFTAHQGPATTTLAHDVMRLLRHWPIYPPFLLLLLWDFAPAGVTVLQYHLANDLHATDGQVGAFYAIFWAAYFPAFVLYGYLCQRVRLSKLLFWGTLVGIPQWLPILLVHNPGQALWMAVVIGLMGGFASVAYVDLAIRSAPRGLQGTMMLLVVTTTFFVASRFGDLWGTDLYDHKGGFLIAVIATTVVYSLMLPVLLLVPKHLTATADGQAALDIS